MGGSEEQEGLLRLRVVEVTAPTTLVSEVEQSSLGEREPLECVLRVSSLLPKVGEGGMVRVGGGGTPQFSFSPSPEGGGGEEVLPSSQMKTCGFFMLSQKDAGGELLRSAPPVGAES